MGVQEPGQQRARILCIQADNCVAENRSRYILGLWAYYVHIGWYDEVHFYSMVVGEWRFVFLIF